MRKLLAFLTVSISFVISRKIFRRQLLRDIWDEDMNLSTQCLRHFDAIKKAQSNGSLDEKKLRYHLESIDWYSGMMVDPIVLPATLTDRRIENVYGDFWHRWVSQRLAQLDAKQEVDLGLVLA